MLDDDETRGDCVVAGLKAGKTKSSRQELKTPPSHIRESESAIPDVRER
jgi:hypothetical protein